MSTYTNQQYQNNFRAVKKSDGYINLSIIFTDASGKEFPIKAPMFGLDANDLLSAYLIKNPTLAKHIKIEILSIIPARKPIESTDLNLNFQFNEEGNPISNANSPEIIQPTPIDPPWDPDKIEDTESGFNKAFNMDEKFRT